MILKYNIKNAVLMVNYKFLNCTQEVFYCLKEAKKIALNIDKSDILKPIHLFISLIFNSVLIQKFLEIHITQKEKQIILNSIFCAFVKNQKKLNNNYITIDFELLEIFNILNISKFSFNTIMLFYFLLRKNPMLFNILNTFFNIKNLDPNNIIDSIISSETNIPLELKNILTVINGKNNIIGRDKEINEIKEVLTRKITRNIFLVGENGVGKLSIIEKIAFNLNNYLFLEIDISQLTTYLNNKGFIILELLFNFLIKKTNTVVYIKNINLLFDSSSDFNSLKYIFIEKLCKNEIQIIASESEVAFNKIMDTYKQLNSIFYKIVVNEPDKQTLFLILKKYITVNNKHKFANILITDSIIENLIELGSKFIKNYVYPEKGILLLDTLLSRYKDVKHEKIITKKDILNVISYYTNISTSLMLKEKNTNINNIDKELKKYVFGQDIAITKISSALKRAYIGLKDKNKPIGSWLLCGPSGTGKTELVKSLAYLLFNSDKNLIRFDMSEFMEKHSISKLIGSPPGYIGYEEGGLLTEKVKNNPYCIILFDEIEKAHRDINNIMLQILDEGHLTDSKGQKIDFTNTLIIFTSNLGCPSSPLSFNSFKEGKEMSLDEYKFLSKLVDLAIKKFFKPEFLNRLDSVIVFKPLSVNCLLFVINKFLLILTNKLKENNILLKLEIDEQIKILMAKIAYHPLYGARPLKRLIEQFIEKPISEFIIMCKKNTPYILSMFKNIEKDTINYSLKEI